MANDPKIDLIASVPLFGACGGPDLQRIAQLLDEVDLPADRVFVRQGDPGREMFSIASGRVVIERDGKVISERGPGAVIGEMALLSEGPRTATVRTLEPTRVFVAAHREFHSLMEAHPTIRMRVLEGLADKIRGLDEASVH